MSVTSWKREQKAGASARRLEMRRGEADVDVAAAVAGAVAELVPPRALSPQVARRAPRSPRRQLQHLGDRPADRGVGRRRR